MLKRIRRTFRPDSGYRAFFLSMITFALAYGLYKGIIDNYLAEIVGMTAFDKGVSEFFRELPGLALVFVLAVLYTVSAENIYKIGALIMLAGMAMQSAVPAEKVFVTLAIFVFSLGDHIQLGMRNTLTLEYAESGHGGEALGLQNAMHQAGMLAGYLIVIVIFGIFESSFRLFRSVFGLSACIIALGFLSSLKLSGNSETDVNKRRFYFHRKFRKYYMLEVFYGARKQIFFRALCACFVLWCGRNGHQCSVCRFFDLLICSRTACGEDHRPIRL